MAPRHRAWKMKAPALAALSEQEIQALEKEVAEEFRATLFREAIRSGVVDPQGKSDVELHILLLRYSLDYLDEIKAAGDISWILDHTTDLLRAARLFRRREEWEIAILLYATWSEHWVNSILTTASKRRRFNPDMVEQVIRDTPFRGKTTWLFHLLELPSLHTPHLAALTELQNLRNGYVHYKFRAHGEAGLDQSRVQAERLLGKVEATIRYLTRYEDRCFFKSVRTRAEKLARKIELEGKSGDPTE